MSRCIVVIPTYNECENLPLLIPRVLAQDSEIGVLVVDDASPDGTGDVADALAHDEARVTVLHREGNRGLGSAYRDGFQHALEQGAELVVQMDADFSHPPDLLPELIAGAKQTGCCMGSRYLKGITVVNWPIERILLSYFGNVYVRWITGMKLSDTTGGFRCMHRDVLSRIHYQRIRADGYAFQIELNFRLIHFGVDVLEIPFFFVDRTQGTSKMTPRIGLEALWRVWVLRARGLLGRL
ncbi:MAG: polyprenol monophosphomannose synthase [Myxococcales bacterium]|nr:polyprenol monophosphomannose synthase [Myxococcales bacterium]